MGNRRERAAHELIGTDGAPTNNNLDLFGEMITLDEGAIKAEACKITQNLVLKQVPEPAAKM